MLKKEHSNLLTQTGPGTPMGQMFRRYWIPALLADELPETDCPPVRVKLLSERLLAFRDSANRYGLIDEFCAQRGMRAALRVSRLEVRRDRPVRRDPVRTGRVEIREENQASVVPARGARRC